MSQNVGTFRKPRRVYFREESPERVVHTRATQIVDSAVAKKDSAVAPVAKKKRSVPQTARTANKQMPYTRDREKLILRCKEYGLVAAKGKGYMRSGFSAPQCIGTNSERKRCKKHTVMNCLACADHAKQIKNGK